MSKLTFSQVLEQVTALESDFTVFRGEDQDMVDLYGMRRTVKMTEEFARDGDLQILSPDLVWAANTVRSDLLAMATEFRVSPLARDSRGGVRAADQDLADEIERGSAIIWGRLDQGHKLSRPRIWRQLINRVAVTVLEFTGLDVPAQKGMSDKEYEAALAKWQREKLPWKAFDVEPQTCSWDEMSMTATKFARRYRQLLSTTEKTYSRRPGTEHADAELMYDGSKWDWRTAEPLSDDYRISETRLRVETGGARELEMLWLADEDFIYHVALNADGKTGELVWCEPNCFGAVPAVLIPGNDTPLRRPEDRFESFLWPLAVDTEQLNMVESMRATAAKNATALQDYVPMDPETVKWFMTNSKPLPDAHVWKAGETPYLAGEIKARPTELSADWDKLEERLERRRDRHTPNFSAILSDPEVQKQGTAALGLAGVESYFRQLAPLVDAGDAATWRIMQMIHHCIREGFADAGEYGDFTLAARGTEWARGKLLKPGDVYTINADSFKFAYDFSVKTRMRTASQAQMRYGAKAQQYLLPDGRRGPAAFDDLMDAADYTDKEAQYELLAEEGVLENLDPWLDQMAQLSAAFEIEADSGIKIPLPATAGAPAPPPGPANAPPAGPGGNQTHAPSFQGTEGGTSPVA